MKHCKLIGLIIAVLIVFNFFYVGTSYGSQAGPAGERALISGVPPYYQPYIEVGQACGGTGFPAGCGTVTGASILAWWERRGVSGLMLGSLNEDGLPYDTIFELGIGQYMDRITDCEQTAVTPHKFKSGLQKWFDDYSSIDFTVSKHQVTPDSDFDYLWELVKNEINNGRPLVYLYRAEGEKENDGYLFAKHYAVIVGYDEYGGKRNLIVQPNWKSGNHATAYWNTYISGEYLDINDYARPAAAIKYNIYTIVPETTPDYEGHSDGWLIPGTEFSFPPYDGVQEDVFEPNTLDMDPTNWDAGTDDLWHKDGTCFVAVWNDRDEDGVYDLEDNCPDIYNPDQADSDTPYGDGVGDVCDYPDVALEMNYRSGYNETELASGKTQLEFTIETSFCNIGTDPVPPDSEFTVTWAQDVFGADSGIDANVTLEEVSRKNGVAGLTLQGEGSTQLMQYNPFFTSRMSFTLYSELDSGESIILPDQVFSAIVDPDDCCYVMHTGNIRDDLDQERDEDNKVSITGYDTMKSCGGVMEIDKTTVLGEDEAFPDLGLSKEHQMSTTEAGIDQVIDIIKDIGPGGGIVDLGTIQVVIPARCFTGQAEVNVMVTEQYSGINPIGSVYDLSTSADMSNPVTITLQYDEEDLGGAQEQMLSLYRFDGTEWEMVQSEVDADMNTVSGSVTGFSLYTIARKRGIESIDRDKFLEQGETVKEFSEYSYQGKKAAKMVKHKQVRLLGLFKMNMNTETIIDLETEEVINVKKPWWSFLAN